MPFFLFQVVAVDPGAGFVTGGGHFISPAGAMPADALASGKATFGFVSKYKKGRSVPTGQTQFTFTAGSLDFHSVSYEWLVITGSDCAKFKGLGMINGEEGFGFMLTACDVDEPGTDADTIRIKIWETSYENVVYDNKIGFSDDSYDGTVIKGGNIQIHQEKVKDVKHLRA